VGLAVARPLLFLQSVTGWLQRLVQRFIGWLLRVVVPKSAKPQSRLSDEEYQELLDLAYQQGTLAQSEKEIILQIVSLDRKRAADVMKSRSRMAAIFRRSERGGNGCRGAPVQTPASANSTTKRQTPSSAC